MKNYINPFNLNIYKKYIFNIYLYISALRRAYIYILIKNILSKKKSF